MKSTYLVITSVADSEHPILRKIANEAASQGVPFVLIGDSKSPASFKLSHCDFYSIERQQNLSFSLAHLLPLNHYARKNIGYLVAMSAGAESIIETDDDNLPFPEFWSEKKRQVDAHHMVDAGWVNIYRYFSDRHIWPRGFSLEHIQDDVPLLTGQKVTDCPIQQGLASENPDVDAIFRLTQPLPVEFWQADNVALGKGSICPFNSQNTTWFKDAFPLLYLPSCCSFRMTDIWRSFIAQRIAWECGWSILFHKSSVLQERNNHNLLTDFKEEIMGYLHNTTLVSELHKLVLEQGEKNISKNLITCYQKLVDLALVGPEEIPLLKAWLSDIQSCSMSQ
ncbi:MAG: STELLO glycosyltransferase family protein [Desulfocapsa sp.]|nr:STELLO glycosyltransferase family protein [Desulfocapsa sp.]